MNELDELESPGLTLPTPWYLAGALSFSIIGDVIYRRGKKASLIRLKRLGIV